MANTFYFPMVLYDTRLIPNFPALARNSQETLLYKRVCVSNSGLPFLHQCFTERRFSPRQRGLSLVPFNNDKSSEPREEDTPALETVLKLYTAIKNQNIHEVSNMIGDECRCVCNFFSSFESFQGKQQVLDFFNYVMQTLGNNIEFVVQPTKYDGMNVGVSWRLEWSKTHMPLGKGFSFYICQIYQGKVTIRNVEMFMEPLLHIEPFRLKIMGNVIFSIEPFRLKIMGNVMSTMEKISSCCKFTQDQVKNFTLAVLLMAIILVFMKPGLY